MIVIDDVGDSYYFNSDMGDNETIEALAHAAAQIHLDILPRLDTGLDMSLARDRERVCNAAAAAFGAVMATIMLGMLDAKEGAAQ